MSPPSVVVYAPGKGAAYGQAVSPSSPRKAWAALERFLDEAAIVLRGPERVTLSAHRPTQWDADPATLERVVTQTTERFGAPQRRGPEQRAYPSGELLGLGALEWLGDDRFAEFRDYLIAGAPWPKATIGPLEVRAHYQFYWRDPDGAGPLPEQLSGHATVDGTLPSEFTVTFAPRSVIAPEFWFPFSAADPRLADLLRLITPSLPFKWSARHFRLAVPKTGGSGYTDRRFDAETLLRSATAA